MTWKGTNDLTLVDIVEEGTWRATNNINMDRFMERRLVRFNKVPVRSVTEFDAQMAKLRPDQDVEFVFEVRFLAEQITLTSDSDG